MTPLDGCCEKVLSNCYHLLDNQFLEKSVGRVVTRTIEKALSRPNLSRVLGDVARTKQKRPFGRSCLAKLP